MGKIKPPSAKIQKKLVSLPSEALVLELVDKRDLKSLGQECPYGFEPRPGHFFRWYNRCLVVQSEAGSLRDGFFGGGSIKGYLVS